LKALKPIVELQPFSILPLVAQQPKGSEFDPGFKFFIQL